MKRIFAQKFPNRQHPDSEKLQQNFKATGSVKYPKRVNLKSDIDNADSQFIVLRER